MTDFRRRQGDSDSGGSTVHQFATAPPSGARAAGATSFEKPQQWDGGGAHGDYIMAAIAIITRRLRRAALRSVGANVPRSASRLQPPL